MTHRQINHMMNKRAHTMAELLVASVIVILLFASTFGAFMITKSVYYGSIVEYNLQRDVNVLTNRILRGLKEGGTAYGLRSAKSYTTPSITEIDFVGTDDNTRRVFLSNNSIIYESATQSPTQKTIYTIPANTAMVLRFWQPTGYTDNETVGIYISLSKAVGSRTATGSLSTYVNIRNLPK